MGLRVEIFRSKTELVIVLRFSGSRGRCPGGGGKCLTFFAPQHGK